MRLSRMRGLCLLSYGNTLTLYALMTEPHQRAYLYRIKRPWSSKQQCMSKLCEDKDYVRFLKVGKDWLLDRSCFRNEAMSWRGLSASIDVFREGRLLRYDDTLKEDLLPSCLDTATGVKKYVLFELYRCPVDAWEDSYWRPHADPTVIDPSRHVIAPLQSAPDDAFHLVTPFTPIDFLEDGTQDYLIRAMSKSLFEKVEQWERVCAVRMQAGARALWDYLPARPSILNVVAYALMLVEDEHDEAEAAFSASSVAGVIKSYVDTGLGSNAHDVCGILGKHEYEVIIHALRFVIDNDGADSAVDAVLALRALEDQRAHGNNSSA
jgi:hypothetical protein